MMVSDPLSDVLTLVNARSVIAGGFNAGAEWSLRFPRPRDVKTYAIVKGSCWMLPEGQSVPTLLEAGDVMILSDDRSFILASDLTIPPMDANALFARSPNKFATLGDGEAFGLLGGHVAFDETRKSLLVDVLPRMIHVKGTSPDAAGIKHLLGSLVEEVYSDRPGNHLAITMLTQLVFLQVIRTYLESSNTHPPGWLRALADERIAPALRLMHSDPSRAWGLEELAKAACLSRSAFASRFKTVAGVAPVTYLLNWRMRLAEQALRDGNQPVSSLAYSLGYTSESAFSNAFKRVVGIAPKHYRARTAA